MARNDSDITQTYPLYSMQHAMLLHSAAAPGEGVYLQQLECRVDEPLDTVALAQAWQRLVDRHAVLRSSFHPEAGAHGEQRVHAAATLPFTEHDWRGLDGADRQQHWDEYLAQDRRRGFRPDAPPLMRVALFRLGESRYRMLWSSHHALFDAHARRLLLRDLFDEYAALRRGALRQPPPPRPYREFIDWLQGADGAGAASFWRGRLGGCELPTPLGIERPWPSGPPISARHEVVLAEDLTEALHALARTADVSVNNVLQGAWALLLSRFGGRDEVVFGVARAGRPRVLDGSAETIGLFVNTLPLRVRVDDRAPLIPWLQSLRDQWRSLREHEHTPLPLVQHALGLSAERPLFESVVSFERDRLDEAVRLPAAPGARFALHERPGVPLVISGTGGRRVSIRLTCDRRRLAPQGVEALAAGLRNVLRAMARAGDARLGALPVMDAAQRRHVLHAWNRTAVAPPGERRVHRLFEAQARRRPHAVAVQCGEQALNYGELNARANRLARWLRRRGVRGDAAVAVCLERGPDLPVALLAVLKAGGAYLPLDPEDPPARRALLVDDAGAALVVTHGGLWTDVAPSGGGAIDLDGDADAIAAQDETNPDSGGGADSLACLMYTSGSTGRPKGVAVRHGAIARLLMDVDYVRLDESTRTLQLAPVSFDASTFELWAPLCHGGRCVLYPERVPTLTRLGEVIRSQGVNTLWLTASLFNTVVDEAPGILEPVAQLLTGGEALSVPHVLRALDRVPAAALVNGYGPTENTTFSCCHRIERARLADADSVPIGRPIAGTRAYVLDHRLEPVPAGVAGELYLAGEGLARGYVRRPGSTAERFLPDPFSAGGGARMYRTGDRVRWRADGTLEFIGRVDAQLKIRGQRIEPGEIESALARHPTVRRAVVDVRPGAAGDRALVAYVVPSDAAQAPTAATLRAFLRALLPPALVPSRFVAIAEVPVTLNGKVDRDALPDPSAAPLAEAVRAAGGDEVESALLAVWRAVLGAEVQPQSDFFELGGHSLQASRIASRINASFGIDLPAYCVFEHPSVAALAPAVRDARAAAGRRGPPAQERPVGELALAPSQMRLWLHDRIEPGSDLFNIPLAFRIDGAMDDRALRWALGEIVQRHEPLRTRFIAAQDGAALQRIEAACPLAFAIDDLRAHPEGERDAAAARLAEAEARRPFDLASAPLLRVRLVRIDDARQMLLITLHHIIADGWSVQVLLRELGALYDAGRRGEPNPLAPLPLTYSAYVRRHGRGSARSLAYWAERLRDAPVLDLPADGQRRPRLGGTAGRCVRTVPAGLSDALAALARQEGTTLFAVLLALFAVLLGRQSGQEEVVVGAPVAGRDAPELEGLVGLFLNTLPLRIDLSAAPSARELLRRVRGVVSGALAHQDVSFERMVDVLEPARAAGRNPFFDVTLNFIQDEWSTLALGETVAQRFEPQTATVKFDLTLYAMRAEEGIRLRLHYRDDLFDPRRMECFMDQLEQLAAQVAEDADTPVGRLSLVTPATRRWLPDPQAVLPEPVQRAVTQEVAMQARRRPDAPAVRWDSGGLSYAELVARADALAAALCAGGVRSADVVAVHGARCAGTVVAMLGVLRAGGVLLTVDPALPAARRETLVREAAARWAVAVGAAPPAAEGWWRLDARTGGLQGGRSRGAIPPHPQPDAPAYVFFTSGSTGAPKAVLGTHKGLAHFLAWQRREFGVGAGDRCAQLSALSFDAVLRDVLLPLSAGGAVCLPAEALGGGDRVVEWLRAAGVTVAHVVPSVAASWLASVPRGAALPDLRLLFFTGEPLPGPLVRRWRRMLDDGAAVVNLYGPTETTLVKCFHRVPDPPAPGTQPVGVPIADTQALVLSPEGRRCGVGERGEIVLRTPFRGLGYANDPAATRRRFVPNPFRDDPADLLYRTGDVGRYRPDGLLEVLGRLDDQVKIHGVRIEPAEVTRQLNEAPGLIAGTVVAMAEGGVPRLVAYAVMGSNSEKDEGLLRDFLRERLPAVMVPKAFVFLDRLPMLPNGKVDRRALPPPAARDCAHDPGERLTPMEAYVAALWQELLDVPRVSRNDNFFALGGHSLLAAQMTARLRADLAVELDLGAVFTAPTPATLARRLTLARRGADAEPIDGPVSGVGDAGPFPLSLAQQRVWFVDQLAPDSAAYNIRFAYRLRGPVDHRALERGLADLVRRHEALRVRVTVDDGQPAQEFVPANLAPLVVEHQDLAGVATQDRSARLHAVLGDFAARPFDLRSPPLLRAALIVLDREECVLALVIHHLAADGWSTGLLIRELAELYGAHRAQRTPDLSSAPRYSDFVAWQRRSLASNDRAEAAIGYWRRRLDGLAVTEIAADRPRPARMSFCGGRVEGRVPRDTALGLYALARRTGATPFVVLLAAFKTLLWRYTGQPDVCVGTPEASRARQELERLVGLCTNTLILRTGLDASQPFTDAVARVRATVFEAVEHADAPFEKIVEALNPDRDPARNPLFQVLFQLQHGPLRPAMALPGVEVEPVLVDNGSTKRDLSVFVQEQGDELRIVVEYDAELFDATTALRLIGHYKVLLGSVAQDPDRALTALPVMDPGERHRLTAQWSGAGVSGAAEACVHREFEAVARAAPQTVAVVYADRRLSYAELDARAERLARYLRARGTETETRIGLCMERSPDAIVAILAVLKAGGAYVPLDPDQPADRLLAMIDSAGLRMVLASMDTGMRLRDAPVDVIVIERGGPPCSGGPVQAPAALVAPANLAYVLFTSGSTGAPKAVAVEHRQVVSYCRAVAPRLGLTQGEHHAMVQPLSVDSSVTSLWGALLTGGTLHLVPREQSLDARALAQYLERTPIDVLKIAPSHLRSLHAAAPDCLLMPRRCLVLGGEELPRAWADALAARSAGACSAFNHYGPTETTVGVMTNPSDAGSDVSAGRNVPLGRPLAGSRVYVLDRFLEPVPIGVPGEIHVAGAQVARGYLDAVRTADRFVPDPFTSHPGERMYRTGDLGRWRADGTVEFLGRMDAEVKIRGFRVDPAEVEALLRAHPQVGSAVVVARPDQAGQTRLVAYVARQAEGARDRHADLGESVHAHLAARLPQYMLPSVVVLERMPLTPQGKLDRNRLPAAPVRHGRGPRTAPRNAVEASLKSIWEELLDVAQVGIDEDFFGLGGHSLLCARLITRINQRFGASIGIRAIFEARTIAAQAALLRPAGEARHGGAAERAQADGGPSPLSFGQLRMWFLDQLAPGLASYNIGVVLRLRGRVNVEALSAALQEIVRRHEVLRTTFHLVDDEPAQIVTPAEAATMELERLHVAGEDAAMAAASDFVHRPFDLRRDLMLRAMLVRQGEAKHLVCAALHHIASDGWSRRVFYRELGTLYAAFDAGRASPLPPLPLQYRDYARWQRAMGREEEASRQLVHWRRALADLPTLDLPTDRPRPALQSHDGARVDFELPPALCAAIEALAREEKATPFMALMAAYQAVLGRRSGQRDFAVGAPVANRSRPEHESLIGFFVNTLALRADLRGRPAFRELLGRVRDTTMNAFEHQDVPFERIVAELAPLRQLGRPPLAQVLLTVQNFPRVDIALPDCRVEVAYARTRTVTFELNLVLYGHERALNGALLYNATLFDRDTAQALVRDFRGLLEAAAARPDVPVDALWPALDVRARERTPGPGQAGGTASAPPRCPMELLAEQARRRPDVEALDDGVRALTYREVWERTNRLGHYLRRRGVGPEVAVGVHLQRGADLPLTMIAVLKAGGVCVPLDPELPPGRLAQMVNVSGLRVIVTDARDGSGWATGCRVLINLGAAQRDIAREPAGRPADTVVDDNLAYVLFTSGTTGEPKGVAMPRRGLANLVGWQISTARKPAARTFQFASAGFDVFFQEVLATLCAGGTLVIPREPARGDFGAMAALIEEQGVERLYVPFVALCRLAETAGARGRSMPALIEVITAGEQAHATGPLREWFGMLHGCRLVNQYGPTETHVVTAFELDPLPVRWPARPPIGRAVAGARVHLLDAGARPVPAGAVGEIYLGGAGLARAYANRPGLTAEHFVPDALSGEPGARLYRTGDRARIGRDGQLEFLGRLDAQVKIRGIRVEPGEIECAVMSHPDVSGCVVVPRQGVPSEPLLVAYVVATRNVSEPGLRAYLSRRLPEVMVPERLVFLPRLPLGANGKVNTGALPEPAIPRGSAQASVAAPASEMERRLMAIWEDVLGAQAIGADDDFFDHGGHSLKAARLVANVRRVLGVDVPLRWLFECRTPRRLAERLAAEAGAPDRDGTPGAESVREAGPAAPRRQVRRGTIPAIHRAAGTGCVARVWCEVLGCGEARPDDDFFDLGGHSLAAVRLANRVASELGVEVPVRLLFEHPGFERFEREVAALVRGVNPSLVAPGLSAAGEASPDALAFESTPLLALVIGGRLPPVDAAALGYFADASIPHCRGGRDGFLRAWCDGLPTVSAITNTPLGRTAIIRVPWLAGALYDDRGALVASVVEAVRLAGAIGARVVSLTGLIPSATDYGRAVVAALPADEGLPAVTTGHATTASSVVLALRRTLREAGRCMDNEHVGFLGLGSIGTASLRLMLERLPQPAALTLCDVYSRRSALEQIAASVRRDCGYRGTLDLVEASPDVPEAFYEAGVVVGATNVPDVLDVARLRPGSLIVDDSGPHCFVPDAAIERFERRGDILFTEGGMLCAPRVLPQVRHLPAAVESIMTSDYLASLRRHEPRSITGCVVSALLGARHPELGVDIGEVAPAAAAAHFDRLLSLGFDAAPLRCGAYTLESDGVARFRQRFSRADRGRDAAPEALGE